MSLPQPRSFKCVLVGDGGTGKTSFVKRHLDGMFDHHYVSTLGVNVESLEFNSSHGLLRFNVWDTAGQEQLSGLRDVYYLQGECGIIMFDHSSHMSYVNVGRWHRDLVRVCGAIPLVLLGNKTDLRDRRFQSQKVTYHSREKLTYYDVSALTTYNLEKPFLFLARQLIGDPKLVFVPKSAPMPIDIKISPTVRAVIEQELCESRKIDLPSEDEDSSSENN